MSSVLATFHPLIAVPNGPNMTVLGRIGAGTLEGAR